MMGALSPGVLLEFVLLAAVWGSSFMWMRLGSLEWGPWPTAGLRVTFACLFLLPLLLSGGRWKLFRQHAGHILIVGLFNSSIPFALYAYAVLSISTGLSSILNATVPLFGALVGWLWMRERPGARRTWGLLIGFAGVALLSWGHAGFKPGGSGWAVLACLAATLSYAIGAFYVRRFLADVPALPLTAGSQLGAALGLAVPTVLNWPAQTPSITSWLAIGAAGVISSALGYLLFYRLIEKAGANRTLTVTYLIPVFATGYGAWLLDESFTLNTAFGAMVVLVGVALAAGQQPTPEKP